MRMIPTCHNFHKVPEQNYSIPVELLHWTCKVPPPSVLPRWLYPDWQEQPEEVVFDSLVTSSVLPPTSWYSWECGWRYSWCQSLGHRCSRRRAWWWWQHLSLIVATPVTNGQQLWQYRVSAGKCHLATTCHPTTWNHCHCCQCTVQWCARHQTQVLVLPFIGFPEMDNNHFYCIKLIIRIQIRINDQQK